MLTQAQIEELKYIYNSKNRFYHNFDHIEKMLYDLKEWYSHDLADQDADTLETAIYFHDIVYSASSSTNEEDSVEFYKNFCEKEKIPFKQTVCDLIMITKNHKVKTRAGYLRELEKKMIRLDINILNEDYSELIEYENKIFLEYQFLDIEKYIKGRVDFLNEVINNTLLNNASNVRRLIKHIESRVYKIGIYPGAFSPFHKGHLNIVNKAESVFDKVVIAKGINREKGKMDYQTPKSLINEIVEYDGLVTDLFYGVKNVKKFMIRGLRNEHDMNYEENLRRTIHDVMPNIEFVYFMCNSEYEHISSSMIRNLNKIDPKLTEKYIID